MTSTSTSDRGLPAADDSRRDAVTLPLPVLAQVVRSGVVESVHHGLFAVVRAGEEPTSGSPVREAGPVDDWVYPRSAVKPLQAVAMVRAGLDLPPDLLALACASHSGQARHLDGARRILASVDLTEDDLQNTPDLPFSATERLTWQRAGRAPAALAQNCSGKHAAMLATCVVNGWSTTDYRDPSHPLQQLIAEEVGRLTGVPVPGDRTGVDGCGAPVLAVTLRGLADAVGRIASAQPGSAELPVAEAMRTAPEFVGGDGRYVTDLMRAVPGVIAKDGAESVHVVGLSDGHGVAVKIADGQHRAAHVVLARLLRDLGLYPAALDTVLPLEEPVLGHGERVGSVRAVLPDEPVPGDGGQDVRGPGSADPSEDSVSGDHQRGRAVGRSDEEA